VGEVLQPGRELIEDVSINVQCLLVNEEFLFDVGLAINKFVEAAERGRELFVGEYMYEEYVVLVEPEELESVFVGVRCEEI
jgi:hypothetical protein